MSNGQNTQLQFHHNSRIIYCSFLISKDYSQLLLLRTPNELVSLETTFHVHKNISNFQIRHYYLINNKPTCQWINTSLLVETGCLKLYSFLNARKLIMKEISTKLHAKKQMKLNINLKIPSILRYLTKECS